VVYRPTYAELGASAHYKDQGKLHNGRLETGYVKPLSGRNELQA
jgi:hypothetical protein